MEYLDDVLEFLLADHEIPRCEHQSEHVTRPLVDDVDRLDRRTINLASAKGNSGNTDTELREMESDKAGK